MKWLTRLKNLENPLESIPTKPTEAPFVGFAGARPDHSQNPVSKSCVLRSRQEPANEVASPDDVFVERVALFAERGLSAEEAEAMADQLARRDLERDERRVCLECLYLFGGADSRRCSQWRRIGQVNGPAIPGELALLLQRCPAFLDRLEAQVMTRKTKALVETPKKPTQDEREWAAKLALSPLVNAAAVTEAYQGNIVGKDADVQTLVNGLHESCETAKVGDLSDLEAMLIGQATALQSIFVSLARRAQVQEYLKNLEAFLALGLKAQAQSRATIQALVELKYPRQVAFVKQANISNGP